MLINVTPQYGPSSQKHKIQATKFWAKQGTTSLHQRCENCHNFLKGSFKYEVLTVPDGMNFYDNGTWRFLDDDGDTPTNRRWFYYRNTSANWPQTIPWCSFTNTNETYRDEYEVSGNGLQKYRLYGGTNNIYQEEVFLYLPNVKTITVMSTFAPMSYTEQTYEDIDTSHSIFFYSPHTIGWGHGDFKNEYGYFLDKNNQAAIPFYIDLGSFNIMTERTGLDPWGSLTFPANKYARLLDYFTLDSEIYSVAHGRIAEFDLGAILSTTFKSVSYVEAKLVFKEDYIETEAYTLQKLIETQNNFIKICWPWNDHSSNIYNLTKWQSGQLTNLRMRIGVQPYRKYSGSIVHPANLYASDYEGNDYYWGAELSFGNVQELLEYSSTPPEVYPAIEGISLLVYGEPK